MHALKNGFLIILPKYMFVLIFLFYSSISYAAIKFPSYSPSVWLVPGQSEKPKIERDKLLISFGKRAYLTTVLEEDSCVDTNCVSIAPLTEKFNSYRKYLINKSTEPLELKGSVSELNSKVVLGSLRKEGFNSTKLYLANSSKNKGKLLVLGKEIKGLLSYDRPVAIKEYDTSFKDCPKTKKSSKSDYFLISNELYDLEEENSDTKKILELKKQLETMIDFYSFVNAYSFGGNFAVKIYKKNTKEEMEPLSMDNTGRVLKYKISIADKMNNVCSEFKLKDIVSELGDPVPFEKPYGRISLKGDSKACYFAYHHREALGATGLVMIPCAQRQSKKPVSLTALPNSWWWD